MISESIDLRQWRQFVTLAQELHFGRAAARLHITQPPLTLAIRRLEAQLEVRLFERTQRSVALTPAGAALLPQVQDLLVRAAALPVHARLARDGAVGHLKLAFVSTVGYALLPQWLQSFRALYPGLQLELLEATGDVQLQAFGRGEIDAGLMLHAPGFAPPGLEQVRVAAESLVLALPEQTPLARARRLSMAAVLAEPLVLFPRRIAPSLHDALMALYHAAGHAPQVAQEAIQMQTIVNLVSAGLGLAWVPHSVTQFQRPGVVYRALGAAHQVRCETSLVWRAGSANPALRLFVDHVRQQLESHPVLAAQRQAQ